MSCSFDLGLGPGPMRPTKVACVSCGDYPDDASSGIDGDDQGLPALRPNVAIIIIGLGFTLFVVAAFAIFAKFMRPHMNRQNGASGSRLWDDVVKDGSPVDAKLIKSLPLVVYSTESFQGLNLDLECAVCLSQFEEGEELRLLPNCKHMFHPSCIDGWLRSHPFCPLCRSNVLSTSWDLHTPPETIALGTLEASISEESEERQRGRDDQQQQSPSLDHIHVEIPVLERFEARFEALRDKCYGRKGKRSAGAGGSVSQEGHIHELEKWVGCDLLAVSSTSSGQGNIGAHTLNKYESRILPVSARCISILPDVHDVGADLCRRALQKEELAPHDCSERILKEGSSSTATSATASASGNPCHDR